MSIFSAAWISGLCISFNAPVIPSLCLCAQMVLMSAQGRSVPAIAHGFSCYHHMVCHLLHAFLDQGLVGLQRLLRDRPAQPKLAPTGDYTRNSLAKGGQSVGWYLSVIELTDPVVLRLLLTIEFFPKSSSAQSRR